MNNYVNICLGQAWVESWESFLDEDLGYFLLAFVGAYFSFLDAIFGFESSWVDNGRPEMTSQLLNTADISNVPVTL